MATVAKECFTEKLIDDVKSTFRRLETTLKSRETQILRQIDVILQQYNVNKNPSTNSNANKCFNKINIVFDNEVEILKAITNFGIIDFEGITLENNLIYQVEEYENPNCDHVCLHKCLNKNLKNIQQAPPDVVPSDQPALESDLDTKPETETYTNCDTNNVTEKKLKTSTNTIVQNLHSYAWRLKSLQSVEDLKPTINDDQTDVSDLSQSEFIDTLQISSTDTTLLQDSIKSESDQASFEYQETSLDETVDESFTTKCFYLNRHEARLARVSLCKVDETDDTVHEKEEVSEAVDENTTEGVKSINSLEPIQQWMQQISREPENEPIQNNELMEHVNITTML